MPDFARKFLEPKRFWPALVLTGFGTLVLTDYGTDRLWYWPTLALGGRYTLSLVNALCFIGLQKCIVFKTRVVQGGVAVTQIPKQWGP